MYSCLCCSINHQYNLTFCCFYNQQQIQFSFCARARERDNYRVSGALWKMTAKRSGNRIILQRPNQKGIFVCMCVCWYERMWRSKHAGKNSAVHVHEMQKELSSPDALTTKNATLLSIRLSIEKNYVN